MTLTNETYNLDQIYLRRLVIGDQTMTARELWTAEYQENNACLIRPEVILIGDFFCAFDLTSLPLPVLSFD